MEYAIIGSGAIGHAIATQFARCRIDVMLANSRGPASLADAVRELGPHVRAVSVEDAARAAITILAVPFVAIPEAVAPLGPWAGRIVVDASNAIDFPQFTPTDLGGRPSSAVVADALPGARVVKAFNTLPAPILATDPGQEGGRRVLFVSGDDGAANAQVAAMIDRLGFSSIVLGALSGPGLLQQFGGPLTVHNLVQYR